MVAFGKLLDAVIGGLDPNHHAKPPECLADTVGHRRTGSVGAEEGCAQVVVELRPIIENPFTNVVEHLDRQTAGVSDGSQHRRRDSTDEDSALHAVSAMASYITCHFAAARGMADMGHALKIKGLHDRSQVIRVGIHVVAVPRLA